MCPPSPSSSRDSVLTRRRFVALAGAGVAASIAGCFSTSVQFSMDEVTDREIVDHASRAFDFGTDEYDIVVGAVEHGAHTVDGRTPPWEPSRAVVFEGTYYDVTITERTVAVDTEHLVSVEALGEETVEDEHDYEDLPAVDQRVFDEVLPEIPPEWFEDTITRLYRDQEREQSFLFDRETVVVYDGVRFSVAVGQLVLVRLEYIGDTAIEDERDYGELPTGDRAVLEGVFPAGDPEEFEDQTHGLYTERERSRSVLLGRETVVVHDGARFSVTAERGPEVERNEYRYTLDPVADSREAFLDWTRETYLFTLDGLTDDEREVVDDAIDGGYSENVEDAFESLARRFHEQRALEADENGGEWLVSYEGVDYHADMRHPARVLE